MGKNKTLSDAKSAKNDGFYTKYAGIQKEVRLLAMLNILGIVWCAGTVPCHYFFDYRVMRPVLLSCAAILFLSLIQYVLLKKVKPLLAIAIAFILHVLSCS